MARRPILIPTCRGIIISSSKARTLSSTFRIPRWWSAKPRSHPTGTRLRALTWGCGCARSDDRPQTKDDGEPRIILCPLPCPPSYAHDVVAENVHQGLIKPPLLFVIAALG